MDRGALDHPLLKDADRFRAWFWLIANAAWHEEGGVVSFTHSVFAAHMGWNQLSAKHCLTIFEKNGMVSVRRSGERVDVTILDRSTFVRASIVGSGDGSPSPTISAGERPRPVFGTERDPITPRLREAVILRDGAKCAYCAAETGPFEIDHVLAVANGGSNDLSNLCVACTSCNRSKGAKLLTDWARA